MKRFLFALAVLTLVLGIFTGCEADTYVKSGVMLYEVYTAGGYNSGETQAPYKNSYAVLYNSSKSDVAIDGWQLLSCNDEGVSIQEQSATLSGTIPAGGFFVISGGIAPDAGLNSAGEFEEENVVGADLPFDIDLDASDFKPNRKEGIIVLASGDVQGS
ncbi:MAG: hypothetical protein LBM28_02525, partial [Oscillospiraceae bacterium]|nr:hypothetical protein [Oscillospiraceae bacterium]